MTHSGHFSGYSNEICTYIKRLVACQQRLYEININENNSSPAFGENVAEHLSRITCSTFINVSIKFNQFNTYNIMVELSGVLHTLAICEGE